jgi:hypothetical protein
MDPSAHPTACEVCLSPPRLRDEPRGRARIYCGTICKKRARRIAELRRRADAWEVKGLEGVAERNPRPDPDQREALASQ